MPNTPKDPHDAPAADGPAAEHLHDDTKRPVKAPVGGLPPNIAADFPTRGGKNFGQLKGKGRNFRHQGR